MKNIFFTLSILCFSCSFLNAQPTLYGVASGNGGNSTISRFVAGENTLAAAYTLEHNGNSPWMSGLIELADGKLYGTLTSGGKYGHGIIYSVDPLTNRYTKHKELNYYTDGGFPYGGLVKGIDGQLYGVTSNGGSGGAGVIFSFDPGSGVYHKKKELSAAGGSVLGSLMATNDGYMYGMSSHGGTNNYGTIFRFHPATAELKILYHLTSSDGRYMYGQLTQGTDGKLYGTTVSGGKNNTGVIFSFDVSTGTYIILHHFDVWNYETQTFAPNKDGAFAYGSLTLASDGKFYGTTNNGGTNRHGILYSYDPASLTYEKIKDFDFNSGGYPYGGLLKSSGGKLFGTNSYGGTNGRGVLFSYDIFLKTYSKVKDLNEAEGANPASNLIEAANGKMYGSTSAGGLYSIGVVYSFDPSSGAYSKLHNFGHPNGIYAFASLTKADNGKLYGVTRQGGAANWGVIYSFDHTTSTYNKLKDLDYTTGFYAGGKMTRGNDGKLYGMAAFGGMHGRGVLYSFDPATGQYIKLKDFDGATGSYPYHNSLSLAVDGKLYGMTQYGGSADAGVIFSYNPATSTYSKLRDLDAGTGNFPYGTVTEADDGKLYGMTTNGGANNTGVLFSFDLQSMSYNKINDFDNFYYSGYPFGSLIKSRNGKLYGTTYGQVISYDPANNLFKRIDPTSYIGSGYFGSLFEASNRKLYGMSTFGGNNLNAGTVYSLDLTDLTTSKLQDFNFDNGSNPGYGASFIEIGACNTLPEVSISTNSPVCTGNSLTLSVSAGQHFRWTGPNGFTSSQRSPVISPAVAGTYKVTVWDEGDCTVSASTMVKVSAMPATPVALELQSDCENGDPQQTITAVATVSEGQSVVWYEASTGGESLQTAPAQTGVGSHTYYAAAKNEAGCESTARVKVTLTIIAGRNYYQDSDSDGYGNLAVSIYACSAPAGYVINNSDCDDNNVNVSTRLRYFRDSDADGFGDANALLLACSSTAPQGYVADSSDADDRIKTYKDLDGDGFGSQTLASSGVGNNADCNDGNKAVRPGATEVCNGVDDNCDGKVDEGFEVIWYLDEDGDGYGGQKSGQGTTCAHPGARSTEMATSAAAAVNTGEAAAATTETKVESGVEVKDSEAVMAVKAVYVRNNLDCNDANPAIHPDAVETCDGIDNNCNGLIDDGPDQDGDGIPDVCDHCPLDASNDVDQDGICGNLDACPEDPYNDIDGDGVCGNQDNCPGEANTDQANIDGDMQGDVCDPDDDGDGVTDVMDCAPLDPSIHTPITYYADRDSDGFGNPSVSITACSLTAPAGYVSNNKDCDDNKLLYADSDGDGYGSGKPVACGVADNTDCNDKDASIFHPISFYFDADKDGYGNFAKSIAVCSHTPPDGYVLSHGDCDDQDAAVYPAATELCDGKDNDCDGQTDEGFTLTTYYLDADKDGYYASTAVSIRACAEPIGYSSRGGDCNDNNRVIHPRATEICDGLDNDCNGVIDERCTEAVVPKITIDDLVVQENAGTAMIKVRLSEPLNTGEVMVRYRSMNGTATRQDYEPKTGQLIFPAGETIAIISIPIVSDNLQEQNEYFELILTIAQNADILDDRAFVTIINVTPVVTGTKLSAASELEPLREGLVSSSFFDVALLPNPTKNQFRLQMKGSTETTPVLIHITDVLGRIIETHRRLVPGRELVFGSSYRPGVYFITISAANKKKTFKLLKLSN